MIQRIEDPAPGGMWNNLRSSHFDVNHFLHRITNYNLGSTSKIAMSIDSKHIDSKPILPKIINIISSSLEQITFNLNFVSMFHESP